VGEKEGGGFIDKNCCHVFKIRKEGGFLPIGTTTVIGRREGSLGNGGGKPEAANEASIYREKGKKKRRGETHTIPWRRRTWMADMSYDQEKSLSKLGGKPGPLLTGKGSRKMGQQLKKITLGGSTDGEKSDKKKRGIQSPRTSAKKQPHQGGKKKILEQIQKKDC